MSRNLFSKVSNSEAEQKFTLRCNDILRRLDPFCTVKFESNEWKLMFDRATKGKSPSALFATLDFNAFESNLLSFSENFEIKMSEEESVVLTPTSFAKWLFLELRYELAVDYRLVWALDVMKMLFMYLTENNLHKLELDQLNGFYSLLLTYDYQNGQLTRRYTTPAYASRIKHFNLFNIKRILMRVDSDVLIGEFEQAEINEEINDACLEQINMTFNDYQTGKSFDFLGLATGRHYIDYCADYFDKYIVFASAAQNALTKYRLNINDDGKADIWKTICSKDPKKSPGFHHVLLTEYNKIVEEKSVFQIDSIFKIAKALKLKEFRGDTHEFIRALLYSKHYDATLKNSEAILEEYKAVLNADPSIEAIEFSLDDFDSVVKNVVNNTKLSMEQIVDKFSSYKSIFGIHNRKTFGSFIRKVEAAGITALVAYTGWRASEYGFTLKSLMSETNIDPIDAVYCPFRFYIKWYSPKTNGKTKLNREITLSTNILIRQLSELTQHESNGFALTSKRKTKSIEIENVIYDMVLEHWLSFPFEYKIFKELDELLSFESEAIKPSKNQRYKGLLKKYKISNWAVKELIKLKDELRTQSPIRELAYRRLYVSGKTVGFGHTLELYQKGTLPEVDKAILDNNLTEETKNYILSDEFLVTTDTVAGIKSELLEGTYGVSPHALRHIWAEAILNRYKGDVGKFIRANFKHIDDRFFIAYIRNKQVKAIMDVAKRTTINSIVRERINSLDEDKQFYTGGFHRFITKAVNLTKVISSEEKEKLSAQVSDKRIIDLKVNPWGGCFFREGTSSIAKCSIDGKPQRHNASPGLCLGCINGDIELGNFTGIVVYTKPDVIACRNPKLPSWIKQYHVETLQYALRRVIELNKDGKYEYMQRFIDYLKETLSIARSSIEAA